MNYPAIDKDAVLSLLHEAKPLGVLDYQHRIAVYRPHSFGGIFVFRKANSSQPA
ncbi:MAG: hypothetical protein ACO3DD_07605 [Burkholderiaceae bacterium]